METPEIGKHRQRAATVSFPLFSTPFYVGFWQTGTRQVAIDVTKNVQWKDSEKNWQGTPHTFCLPPFPIHFFCVCLTVWCKERKKLTCRWNLFLWRNRKLRVVLTTADAHRRLLLLWTHRDSFWLPLLLPNTRATTLVSCHASIPTHKLESRLYSRLLVNKLFGTSVVGIYVM